LDLGRAYEKNEETDKAKDCYEKALNLNGQYGAGFLRLGILLKRKAEYDKSNEAFDRAENIYDRLSNDEGVAEVKYQRGVSFNIQEKSDAALLQFEQVIGNPRANNYQQIRAMLQISSVCSSLGKTRCAEEYASKAIALAKQERMENLASNGLISLGNAFLVRADYGKAEQNFRQALEFSRKDEGLNNEARALLSLGSLRIQQKKPDEAADFVRQALPFYQKGGYQKEVAQANLILGRAAVMRENYDQALRAFEQVENSEQSSISDRAYAKMAGGDTLIVQEKYPAALKRFEQSYDLYQSLDNSFYAAHSLFYSSDVLYQLGRFEEAKDKLSKARTILDEGENPLPQLNNKIHFLNARIALSNRDFTVAIVEAKQTRTSNDSPLSSEANQIIGLTQTFINPRSSEGIQNCIKAVQQSINTNDARKINSAKLTLAEGYFNTGNYSDALETALQTKDYFINSGQTESGWRAWLIAGKAGKQKGDDENARKYGKMAIETLSQLQNDWGAEYFNVYLKKPDINLSFKEAENLAKL